MPKSKEQKRKDRERRAHAKVLRRREAIRAKAKQEKEAALEDRKYQRLANRAEGRTYVNRDPETQHELIERNLKILEALEEQRKALEAAKDNAGSLKEAAKASGFGISADVSFTPNPMTLEPLQAPIDQNAAGDGVVVFSGKFDEKAEKKFEPASEVVFTPKSEDTVTTSEPVKDVPSVQEKIVAALKEHFGDDIKKTKRVWGKKKQ